MSWKRSFENRRRLKKLAEVSSYPSGAYYAEGKWIRDVGYVVNPKPYYKRYYRGNHKGSRFSYYKKHSNRQIRNYKEGIPKGGSYKKCFDYWYTVL